MAQVITFEDFIPTPRYDATTWTHARIEEGTTSDGPWVALETIALDPLDADPENPASRDLTTELADDASGLWYRIVFVDGSGDESIPTTPLQNGAAAGAYASVSELARILKIRTPTDDHVVALERVLVVAAGEIDSEIDRVTDLAGWQLALVAEVNLQRAAEIWKEEEIQFGIVGLGSEFGGTHIARDLWFKHALKLAPLKEQWGIA